MNLKPTQDDGRWKYWRCSNSGDDVFTNVRKTTADYEDLSKWFDVVEESEYTLPAWRLYDYED